jgi:hypothetical protein
VAELEEFIAAARERRLSDEAMIEVLTEVAGTLRKGLS